MKSGIINVYKEAGYTSFDVVAKLRGILQIKKIGHTGTLDPDATGVLPICIGKATKVCGLLTDSDKTYEVVMRLGVVTDTLDMSGRILQDNVVNADEGDVIAAINSFVGNISQIPPMYSALKVGGKKLYELAREGVVIERKPRPVTIYSIDVISVDMPFVKMSVSCSKGTYIRSLCDDIGNKLGCGACMESLVRTRAAGFDIEDAHTLSEIERYRDDNRLDEIMFGIDSVMRDYPPVKADCSMSKVLQNGGRIPASHTDCPHYPDNGDISAECRYVRMYMSDGEFVGIYERDGEEFKPHKMFYEA